MAEQFQDIFNEPESETRLGRPSSLDDPTLENHRDRLVAIFEASWGEIGWKIQKCKEPDDLIAIFSGLPGANLQDVIAVFCVPSTLPASSASLRKSRSEQCALVEPQRNASELSRHADERLQSAQQALYQARGSKRKLVRRELVKRKQESDQRRVQSQSITEKDRSLAAQVKSLEASVARHELFRFLKSRRYELNPLNLANAAAGLPYMGWRQSMRRCVKARSRFPEGSRYQVFKAIRYLISSSPNKTEKVLVSYFRESIPRLPRRYRLAKVEMAENWFYLERAIRQICRQKTHPRALPFAITERHFKRPQSQTYADILLAERAKLILSN